MLEPFRDLLQVFRSDSHAQTGETVTADTSETATSPPTTTSASPLHSSNGAWRVKKAAVLFESMELLSSTCETAGSVLVQPMPQLLVSPGLPSTQIAGNENELLTAVRRNDEARCKAVLSRAKAAHTDTQDVEGRSALHWAALSGSVAICRLLLGTCGKSVLGLRDKLGRTALHCACLGHKSELAKLLVKAGADFNAADKEGNTPLHYAAVADEKQLVECLMKAGANERTRNNEGRIPQDIAGPLTVPLFHTSRQSCRIPITASNQPQIDFLMGKSHSYSAPTNKPGLNDYELVSLLGKGSFGEVFLVKRRSDDAPFAMKVLKKEVVFGQNLIKYAMTERNVLSYIKHPFIVSLECAFQTNNSLFLLLSYCPGGDLTWHLSREKRFSEHRARIYAAEVVLALEELHRRNIIFRDLKPDNVVIDAEGHAMLTDFGLSREGVYSATTAKSFCGSLAYLAPEVIRRKGHGKAVDWYLLGVLLYEMMTGAPPYLSQSRKQLLDNILSAQLHIPDSLSSEAKEILSLVSAN